MTDVLPDLTGVVLAGGPSRRMAADKAWLPVHGVPMIRRVVDALRACCVEVVVVAKDPAAYGGLGTRVVADGAPERAPLIGLCAGLGAASTPLVAIAACDLPFLSDDAMRLIARAAAGWDAAVPRVHGRRHPLHAVYAAAARPVLLEALAAGTRRLGDALGRLRVRTVTADELRAADPALRTLVNVNTPDEYKEASAPTTNLDR